MRSATSPAVPLPSLPAAAPTGIDPRLVAALASVYLIWGSTYLVMRLALAAIPPLLMGAIRFTAAGAVLLAAARVRGTPWPTLRQWRDAAILGALFFVGGNGFVAIGMQTIDSGVAAVTVATMPLWAAVIASLTGERATAREWIGLGIGFAGVVVLVGGAPRGGDVVHWIVLCLAPVAWATGSILSRRLPLPGGLAASAMTMIAGGVLLAGLGLARGERVPVDAPADAWLAVLYLAVLGSIVGFSAYGWLLRNTRASTATSYAYVNPAIAVLLGAAVAGEPVGVATVVATAMIIGAVALVVTRR